MKAIKITNLVSTGLLTVIMLMSAGMYFFNNGEIQQGFSGLGFPTFIIYPLAVAKLLGLLAIWAIKSNSLKEWAYAGFFFNTLLALSAHLMAGDGEFMGAMMGIILVLISYFSWKKLAI